MQLVISTFKCDDKNMNRKFRFLYNKIIITSKSVDLYAITFDYPDLDYSTQGNSPDFNISQYNG